MDENKTVSGLTTLPGELYVHYDTNNYITVYDIKTYSIRRIIDVPSLSGQVNDVTSCKTLQCLYVSDHGNNFIHRVDVGNMIKKWSANDEPGGLSVNLACNVLVTCYCVGKVKEFTPDGELFREINLDSSIEYPMHTIELAEDQYFVCHGYFDQDPHGVSLVNSLGRVLKSYGGVKGSGKGQVNRPIRLLLIGGILVCVSDCRNQRVLMFTQTLGLIRQLPVTDLKYPCGMWFDEQNGRLYVADNKLNKEKWTGGHIKIYSL